MPGLPQEIIIDLTNLVKYPENIYKSFGIFCWHGYNSNPKVIELLINESNDIKNEYQSLGIFNLELKSGIQIFNIKYNKNITNCKNIKFLKIIIKENFGEKWTYINQIMLYEEDEKYINNILKESLISLKESEESFDNDIDIDLDNEKNIKNKNRNNTTELKEEYSKFNDNIDISYSNNEDINKKFNIDDNNNIKKNTINKSNKNKLYHVERIEKILKKNILENDNDIDKLSNISQQNNNLSNNKIFKNVYTNTPNRFIFNKTNIINKKNNINDIIIDKKRPFTPNIIHTKENENIIDNNNNYDNNEPMDSKDYDNILKTQLKDMENQIDLLNKINISNEKAKNFGKTITHNYNKDNINKNIKDELNIKTKEKTMNKTSYNKFYSKLNIHNIKNNNKIDYKENKLNTISLNNKNNKKKNEFNTPQSDIKNHNLFQNSIYSNLNDLTSNNSLDINQRLSYLEHSVFEIRQELNSMSQLILDITSGKYIQNNLKQNIKLILDEYLNEKNLNNKNNNEDINERSFYNEILSEENKQKNIENEINKKIDKKLYNITEQIKYDIYNKYIKPSLNQIEFNMKQSIDELKNKLDKKDKNSKLNNNKNYNTINNINNKNVYEQNNFSGIQSNNDILYNSSSKLTEEKYEEINKLGEKLYQKLLEKEKKLKLLKKETSKFLEDE